LPADAREEIAFEIRQGESVRQVVDNYLPRSEHTSRSESSRFRDLVAALRKALADHAIRHQDLPDTAASEAYDSVFRETRSLLVKLERWNKAAAKRCPRDEGLFQLIQTRATRMSEEVL
jgi:hypothetical protein